MESLVGVASGRVLVKRLKELEERLLKVVNEVLARLGAEPLSGITLSLRERLEEKEREPQSIRVYGRYLPDERRIILYSEAHIHDLLHELVHHLQVTGHNMVKVDAELVKEAAERLPYDVRPAEMEAEVLANKLLGDDPAGRTGSHRGIAGRI